MKDTFSPWQVDTDYINDSIDRCTGEERRETPAEESQIIHVDTLPQAGGS